jgi:hypothetical protein
MRNFLTTQKRFNLLAQFRVVTAGFVEDSYSVLRV